MSTTRGLSSLEIAKLFDAKVRSGLFNKLPGYITSDANREDRTSEGLLLAFEQFMRKAQSTGEIMSDRLLFHIARQCAVNYSRRFVRGDRIRRCWDVYDPRTYHSGDVTFHRLSVLPEDRLYLESHIFRDDPEQLANTKLDADSWKESLSPDDADLVRRRLEGQTLCHIANQANKSTVSICRRRKKLQQQFCEYFDL